LNYLWLIIFKLIFIFLQAKVFSLAILPLLVPSSIIFIILINQAAGPDFFFSSFYSSSLENFIEQFLIIFVILHLILIITGLSA